jgi:hypothetical protein
VLEVLSLDFLLVQFAVLQVSRTIVDPVMNLVKQGKAVLAHKVKLTEERAAWLGNELPYLHFN